MAMGLLGTLGLLFYAMQGPSASRASSRRLESVRERHSKSNEVAAQAQLKRILQNRNQSKVDGLAQRFIPNPALLRQRLQQTGKNWSLGRYALASLGLTLVVALALLT
ncbi:MAG: pilus assembly protein TadB, partial [Allosphingosinicella sp.]